MEACDGRYNLRLVMTTYRSPDRIDHSSSDPVGRVSSRQPALLGDHPQPWHHPRLREGVHRLTLVRVPFERKRGAQEDADDTVMTSVTATAQRSQSMTIVSMSAISAIALFSMYRSSH